MIDALRSVSVEAVHHHCEWRERAEKAEAEFNAGRSQMAAAFFNKLADPKLAHAISAGTQPGEHVHPEVVTGRTLSLPSST